MGIVREFVSTVCIIKDGKMLMVWNKNINAWIPVGGHIEPNELPCDSAIREAKEETGLDIKLISPYEAWKTKNLVQPVHVHLDPIKEDHEHINLMYFGTVVGGELLEESDEQTPLKWFSKEDLEKEDIMDNVRELALEALNQLGDKY